MQGGGSWSFRNFGLRKDIMPAPNGSVSQVSPRVISENIAQPILEFGDNSVFIDLDPDEASTHSFWLRVGHVQQADCRVVRLTPKQAKALAYALLVHGNALISRTALR